MTQKIAETNQKIAKSKADTIKWVLGIFLGFFVTQSSLMFAMFSYFI